MRSLVLSTVFLALAAGCSGRSMGGEEWLDGGNGTGDAGLIAPDPCEPMDAYSVVFGECAGDDWAGFAWDGVSCRGVYCQCGGADCDRLYASEQACWDAVVPACTPGPLPQDGCEAQDVWACPDDCADLVGYAWEGEYCAPILCCCEGPDCGATYGTLEECVADRGTCWEQACTELGGYCAPDSGLSGGCAVGHHPDDTLVGANPGICGGGSCCVPCDPLEGAVQMDYIEHSPEACADIDWDCFSPGWTNFQNECGCGCALME